MKLTSAAFVSNPANAHAGTHDEARRPSLAGLSSLVAVTCLTMASLAGCGSSGSGTPSTTGGRTGSATGGTGSGGQGTPGSGGSSSGTGGMTVTTGGNSGSTGGSASGGTNGSGTGGGSTGGATSATGGAAGGGNPNLDGGVDSSTGGSGGASGGRGGNATGGAGGSVPGSGGAGGASMRLRAVMVVQASGTPTAGDNVMLARMTARGIQTTIVSDGAATAAGVAGMDLVVISSSAESGPLGAKLRNVAIPVLCIENGEYPLMGFTATTLNTDYGQLAAQTQVTIATPATALVGTLAGTLTISRTAGDIGWGIPPATALKGATVPGTPTRAVVFGYAKGDQMVGLTAPARRAAFAIRETLAANLTADGMKLFDAVLDWVLM